MSDSKAKIPKCLGIIMDGNRRWAKEKGLPPFAGHDAGYKKLKEAIRWSKEAGIKTLVVYAFSSENWQRGEEEKKYLFKLLKIALTKEKETLKKDGVRVSFIGQTEKFSEDIQKFINELKEETKNCSEINLVVALSYGGRDEILSAVKNLVKEKTKEDLEKLDEEEFSQHLWTKDFPDPDLIIRTSGEHRLSGFLPWQSVYSELVFTKTYWPDLGREEFNQILDNFSTRKRRLGK